MKIIYRGSLKLMNCFPAERLFMANFARRERKLRKLTRYELRREAALRFF